MASNLKRIRSLPLQLINAVVVARKGHILKSVSYPHHKPALLEENGETVVTAFQKLAQLQPKLTNFNLLPLAFLRETENSFEMIKPLIFSVLESSAQSLGFLFITPTEKYGFQNFPRLEGLKILEFCEPDDEIDEGLYFPGDISLTEIFPNVREIRPRFPMTEDFIENYLPENILSPWGSQIKVLKVSGLSSNSIALLQKRFPSIEELKVLSLASEIAELLPALAEFWPGLKSLTIGVSGYVPRINNNSVRPLALDIAITGLSEETVGQLLDPANKGGKFTAEEIQGFKEESPMSKLKELKELKLILLNFTVIVESEEKLKPLTPVANEFGFKLLPHLKVTLGIWRNHKHAEAMKTALEPLAQCENIHINDSYFDGEWGIVVLLNQLFG